MYSFDELKNALEEIDPTPKIQSNPLVFTRYLYPKEQVKQSLFIALLEKQVDEALFWTYELYHSGFQEEVYKYIYSVYEILYKSTNCASLGKCIVDLYGRWSQDNSQHYLFGSMIKNLVCRTYNVNLFMEMYLRTKCDQSTCQIKEGKFLRMNLSEEDAKRFETIPVGLHKARLVLATAYKYSIRHNIAIIFECSNRDIVSNYRMHWTYYCWDCPYWRNIMEGQYFGRINHEERTVDFYDNARERFYDQYGYEPDEQTMEVQQNSIGRGDEEQMMIKDFADRYGGTIVKKTIRVPKQSHK